MTLTLSGFEALRRRPIPDQGPARAVKRSFRTIRIAPNSDDLLMEAGGVGLLGKNHYAHALNPPYWRAIDGAIDALWMRRAVAERLSAIDAQLKPHGLRVFVLDAWRPRAVQAYFHDVWMPQRLRAQRPDLEGPALWAEVERYWSAPTVDAASPAPHETGAAVDVTLMIEGGAALYMGAVFDDPTPLAAPDFFEHAGGDAMALSTEEARGNRRLLHWLMVEAGFAAHPDEWWHFSYGDQMWATLTGAPEALYGLAAPPG